MNVPELRPIEDFLSEIKRIISEKKIGKLKILNNCQIGYAFKKAYCM